MERSSRIKRQRRAKEKTSGEIARIRLTGMLASDYLECSPEQFEILRKELLEILSRYIDINETQQIQLNIVQELKQGVQYVKTIQVKGL